MSKHQFGWITECSKSARYELTNRKPACVGAPAELLCSERIIAFYYGEIIDRYAHPDRYKTIG
jgi:hypothetical protein